MISKNYLHPPSQPTDHDADMPDHLCNVIDDDQVKESALAGICEYLANEVDLDTLTDSVKSYISHDLSGDVSVDLNTDRDDLALRTLVQNLFDALNDTSDTVDKIINQA